MSHVPNSGSTFNGTPTISAKPSSIIKEGLVTKQGGRIKTWKRRWCVLTEHGMLYYKYQENSTLRYNNIQGHIELDLIESVDGPVQEKSKRKFCFQIVTPNRTFIISAANDEDMYSWISALKDVLSRRKGTKDVKHTEDSDLSAKSAEDLQAMLTSLDERMKSDISSHFEGILRDKDEIIDSLMEREIQEVKQRFVAEQADIHQELHRRLH